MALVSREEFDRLHDGPQAGVAVSEAEFERQVRAAGRARSIADLPSIEPAGAAPRLRALTREARRQVEVHTEHLMSSGLPAGAAVLRAIEREEQVPSAEPTPEPGLREHLGAGATALQEAARTAGGAIEEFGRKPGFHIARELYDVAAKKYPPRTEAEAFGQDLSRNLASLSPTDIPGGLLELGGAALARPVETARGVLRSTGIPSALEPGTGEERLTRVGETLRETTGLGPAFGVGLVSPFARRAARALPPPGGGVAAGAAAVDRLTAERLGPTREVEAAGRETQAGLAREAAPAPAGAEPSYPLPLREAGPFEFEQVPRFEGPKQVEAGVRGMREQFGRRMTGPPLERGPREMEFPEGPAVDLAARLEEVRAALRRRQRPAAVKPPQEPPATPPAAAPVPVPAAPAAPLPAAARARPATVEPARAPPEVSRPQPPMRPVEEVRHGPERPEEVERRAPAPRPVEPGAAVAARRPVATLPPAAVVGGRPAGAVPEPVATRRHVPSGPGSPEREGKFLTARAEYTHPADEGRVPRRVVEALDPQQRQGVAKAIDALDRAGGFLLADGTGRGKTRQILGVAAHHVDAGRRVIVIAPSQVMQPRWETMEYSGSYATDSKSMGVPIELTRAASPLEPGKVYLTTYENLRGVSGLVDKNTVVVFDEAHYLKNVGAARSLLGREIAAKAKAVLYATATPADKPTHIEAYARMGVFEGQTPNEAMEALGLRLTRDRRGKVFWTPDTKRLGRHAAFETLKRLNGLFDRLTDRGLMAKRELAWDGVQVDFETVPLPAEVRATMDRIQAGLGHRPSDALMHQRRQQEPHKIPRAVEIIKEELAAGRQVVVYVDRVSYSKAVLRTRDPRTGEIVEDVLAESEGTAKALAAALKTAGVDAVTELHGATRTPKAEAIEAFQTGKAKVMVATTGSGGIGINLDDVGGKAPRTMVVMTAPFSGVENVQMGGRIWRSQTASLPRIRYLFSDLEVDRWNRDIIAAKMKTLGATVAGEVGRLDVSKLQEAAARGEVGAEEVAAGVPAQPAAPRPVEPAPAPPVATVAPPVPAPSPAPAAAAGPERGWRPVQASPGRETTVLLSGGVQVRARYAYMEATDLEPSHLFGTWQPNPQYYDVAAGVNARRNLNVEAAAAVARADPNALRLILSDDPTTTGGPPLVTPSGRTLNNARSIGIKEGYSQGGEPATAIRAAMLEAGDKLGADRRAAESMRAPALVRVLEHEPATAADAAELAKLTDRPLTKTVEAPERAASMGRTLQGKPETLAWLAEEIGERRMREALSQPKTARAVLDRLIADRLISTAEAGELIDAQTLGMTDVGKGLVERAAVGAVVPDAHLLTMMPADVRQSLVRIAAPLARTQALGSYSLSDPLRQAVALLTRAKTEMPGMPLADYLRQKAMPGIGHAPPTPEVAKLAAALDGWSTTNLRDMLAAYTKAAAPAAGGQRGMFGAPPAPAELLGRVLDAPRGGTAAAAPPAGELHAGFDPRPALREVVDLLRPVGRAVTYLFKQSKQLEDLARDVAPSDQPKAALYRQAARDMREANPAKGRQIAESMFTGFRDESGLAALSKEKQAVFARGRYLVRHLAEQGREQDAQAMLAELNRDPAFAKANRALDSLYGKFVWPTKAAQYQNLVPARFYVPRIIPDTPAVAAAIEAGQSVEPHIPPSLPRGTVRAKVARPGYTYKSGGPRAWYPDMLKQVERDLHRTMGLGQAQKFIGSALKTGRLLEQGEKPGEGLVAHQLRANEVKAAKFAGLLPDDFPADRMAQLEVHPTVRYMLEAFSHERDPTHKVVDTLAAASSALNQVAASGDVAGLGLQFSQFWRAAAASRPGTAYVAIVRGTARGIVNNLFARGSRGEHFIPRAIREAAAYSPLEWDLLRRAQASGLNVGGTPVEVEGMMRWLMDPDSPPVYRHAKHAVGAYFELQNRVQWYGGGARQTAMLYMLRSLQNKTLLRQAMEKAGLPKLAMRLERARGKETLSLDDPASLDKLKREIYGVLNDVGLHDWHPRMAQGARASIMFPSWFTGTVQQAMATTGVHERGAARVVRPLSTLAAIVLTVEALNYMLTARHPKGAHFTWENDPNNQDSIETSDVDATGATKRVPLGGAIGMMSRMLGLRALFKNTVGVGRPIEAADVATWARAVASAGGVELERRISPLIRYMGGASMVTGTSITGRELFVPGEPGAFGAGRQRLAKKMLGEVVWPARPALERRRGTTDLEVALETTGALFGFPVPTASQARTPVLDVRGRNAALKGQWKIMVADGFMDPDEAVRLSAEIKDPYTVSEIRDLLTAGRVPSIVREAKALRRHPAALAPYFGAGEEEERVAPRRPAAYPFVPAGTEEAVRRMAR